MPGVSVIIPTHARPERLRTLVRALANQSLEASRYEVLVGVDGRDEVSERVAREAWGERKRDHDGLTVRVMEKQGQASVRNALIREARGELLVFLNDDMVPGPEFLSAHARAHEDARNHAALGSRPVIVIGASPWTVPTPDRLFDRLLRETSMVFFHDQMTDPDPWRDWGFRHAWLLNLSVSAAAVREVGMLTAFPSTYGYEDDELAYRLHASYGSPVLYRPEAIARHDHHYQPREYLEREFKLGYAALGFARTTPACAREMFRRDVASEDERAYSAAFVERERTGAARAMEPFESLARIPAHAISATSTDHTRELLTLLYQQHLPLKRWMWRAGLLAAHAGEPITRTRWPDE